MNDVFECIDQQLDFNKGKNLFYVPTHLDFIQKTKDVLKNNKSLVSKFHDLIIDYICEKVLLEFYRINQFYTFDQTSKNRLHELYVQLFAQLSDDEYSLEEVSKRHYENLKRWLTESNRISTQIYSETQLYIHPVVCSEYSAEFQCKVLNIRVETLNQPILDIGCGNEACLLRFFNSKGFDVFGIDRFETNFDNTIMSDWLNFDYGSEKWGTIVSNMAFSNHFVHHHYRNDGDFLNYATKYMAILNSLKIGGSFYYSPDLPFIESYLDPIKFSLEKVKVRDEKLFASCVKRLK